MRSSTTAFLRFTRFSVIGLGAPRGPRSSPSRYGFEALGCRGLRAPGLLHTVRSFLFITLHTCYLACSKMRTGHTVRVYTASPDENGKLTPYITPSTVLASAGSTPYQLTAVPRNFTPYSLVVAGPPQPSIEQLALKLLITRKEPRLELVEANVEAAVVV